MDLVWEGGETLAEPDQVIRRGDADGGNGEGGGGGGGGGAERGMEGGEVIFERSCGEEVSLLDRLYDRRHWRENREGEGGRVSISFEFFVFFVWEREKKI